MLRLQPACKADRDRWHGLRRLAADTTTLALPETKSLWKAYGAHNGERGLGAIAVELCCLFDLVSRAPLRFVAGKASTSEHKLIPKLIEHLWKNDPLLLDAGAIGVDSSSRSTASRLSAGSHFRADIHGCFPQVLPNFCKLLFCIRAFPSAGFQYYHTDVCDISVRAKSSAPYPILTGLQNSLDFHWLLRRHYYHDVVTVRLVLPVGMAFRHPPEGGTVPYLRERS